MRATNLASSVAARINHRQNSSKFFQFDTILNQDSQIDV